MRGADYTVQVRAQQQAESQPLSSSERPRTEDTRLNWVLYVAWQFLLVGQLVDVVFVQCTTRLQSMISGKSLPPCVPKTSIFSRRSGVQQPPTYIAQDAITSLRTIDPT